MAEKRKYQHQWRLHGENGGISEMAYHRRKSANRRRANNIEMARNLAASAASGESETAAASIGVS